MPESPRWLASKGRHKEAKEVMERVAKMNGKSLDMEELSLHSLVDSGSEGKDEQTDGKKTTKVTPWALFRIPRLFFRFGRQYLTW